MGLRRSAPLQGVWEKRSVSYSKYEQTRGHGYCEKTEKSNPIIHVYNLGKERGPKYSEQLCWRDTQGELEVIPRTNTIECCQSQKLICEVVLNMGLGDELGLWSVRSLFRVAVVAEGETSDYFVTSAH